MRTVLKSSSEVFHFWANQTQSEGRAGNVFFRDSRVYSYGSHFCIARILPDSKTVAMTTRRYSVTTSKHVNEARAAVRHMHIVYCNDPGDSARQNMAQARADIGTALVASGKKGIRQTTRDAHKGQALHFAEQANEYLAALPETEREGIVPIDTSSLEAVRATLIAAEIARDKIRAEQHAARLQDLQESLAKWRTHEIVLRTGLHDIPTALRLSQDKLTVQTSRGADIPITDALKLWPMILRVMRGVKDYQPGEALGAYRLTQIKTDGSIIVGCHNIAFSEIQGIARELGVTQS